MAQTYAVYYGALFIIGIVAFFSEKYNNKKSVYLIIAILTVIAGMRKYSVGIDSEPYYEKFMLIADNKFDVAYGLETSFKYICYFLLKICCSYTFLFTVFAFITSYFIVMRLWDLRRISSFSCSVICYYMAFYAMSMNTMRQFIAIAIIFFATKYLAESKYLTYVVSVAIAMLFHQTAAVGLLLLGIIMFDRRDFSFKKRIMFIFAVIVMGILAFYKRDSFVRYGKYVSQTNVDIGIMVFGKLLFAAATMLFVFVFRGNYDVFSKKNALTITERKNAVIICVSYLIGIAFALLSYILPGVNRIGWYFFVFEEAYMGILMKSKAPSNKLIFIYCICILSGWGFYASIAGNSQGTVPYMFFWQ